MLGDLSIQNPVIVVGRPRSGSSIFTRLLNESPDLYIVNDLYYLQYVDSLNGFSQADASTVEKLARHLLATLENRARPDDLGIAGIECERVLTSENRVELETFVEQCIKEPNHNWASILSSIMQFYATLIDKKQWGYNTPQDYLHLPRLQQTFLNAKFIFVMRNPLEVLRSYKNLTYRKGFHDPAYYHPALQAIAWKSAIACYLENQHRDNFLLVRYEDLIDDVNGVFADVGNFLGLQFPALNLNNYGNNSSFKNKPKKLPITSTEAWLCEQIAGKEMQAAGYSLTNRSPSPRDLGDLLGTTTTSLGYYLRKSILSSDTRKRIIKLATFQYTSLEGK